MMKLKLASLAIAGAVITSGCVPANQQTMNTQSNSDYVVYQQVEHTYSPKVDPIIVRVTGYGAYLENPRMSKGQNQLMAMRASKLDAYRAIAERVYGTRVSGGSTVEALVLRDDRFRTYVDTVIRGAKVISTYELAHNNYETTMELVLEPTFYDCLGSTGGFQSPSCTAPTVHGESPETRAIARPLVKSQPSQYYLN
ncbi:LPP20 family lipoprotein [Oceanospirillum maris]|uniref:LPP20 family lipoprotein n=1 Tax=Oceanospirillum maris TaxID=64977 RepID=UPI0004217269|nr:LPP20 family lipoprotein [Oceanospirillum maris]